MEFCPTCGMLLQYQAAGSGRKSRLFCPTCPYIYSIDRKIVKREYLPPPKKADEIISDEDALKTQPRDKSSNCKACGFPGPHYIELQTRSADEPATLFFTCSSVDCRYKWTEN